MENSFIAKINEIYEKLGSIVTAGELFNAEVVSSLNELKDLNISLIIEDFKKGNYLGNRKIDIDLSLNNSSTTESATYRQADVILVDGTKLEMPFDNGSGGILELSSHADIKNYIVNHILYTANVVDTEIVVYESFADTPIMIRVRDADGKSSNIERVELYAYTGTVENTKVSYFWAKTTSALETLANRVGDIIKLGNDIGGVVQLSGKLEELLTIQEKLNQLMIIHNNLTAILNSEQYAQTAYSASTNATSKATIASEQAAIATNKAIIASEQAAIAKQKADLILAIKAQGVQLASGQTATATYNSATNTFTFGIPSGLQGERGDAFVVNMTGLIGSRSAYDGALKGFSYLSLDETPTKIYFKKSDTLADWTAGVAFGKGDPGPTGPQGVGISSISRTAGTGIAGQTDVYTIYLSNNTEYSFNVYNGANSDIDSSDLTSLADILQQSISASTQIITNHKADIQNPHQVTKAQIELGNVQNYAPLDMPLSSAEIAALALKANIADIYTKLQTDSKISAAIATLVASSPATLDTLNELATALGNDANFSTTMATALGLKAPTNNPVFTGTVTGPTFAGNLSGNATTATTAVNANKLIGKNWNWSGQGGQPAWVWGGSDGENMYVYNPANFSVNYAASAGYAGSAGSANSVSAAVVGSAITGLGAGAVGSYAFLGFYDGDISFGTNVAGSSLTPISTDEQKRGSVSGTWRCMGNCKHRFGNSTPGTLYLRIA